MLLPENSAIAEKVTKITLHKFPPFLYLLHPALGILTWTRTLVIATAVVVRGSWNLRGVTMVGDK